MQLSRSPAAAAATLVAAMVLASCAPEAAIPTAATVTLEPREIRAPAPSPPPDPRPDVIWPLTGIDALGEPGEVLNRPALSIKIENSLQARPQTNLQHADVVYEEYVEYGISRLIAVYHSQWPETVGPIRSMRPMDHNIIGSYEGPLIFSGAQRRFISAAQSAGQELIAQDIGSSGFFRVTSNSPPSNLHGNLQEFHAQTDAEPPPVQWDYAYPAEFSTAQRDGEEVSHLDLFLSARAQPEWRWDEAASRWMRYEGSDAHVTADGTQLSATNIVMLWVDVRYTSSVGGSSVPETLMVDANNSGYVVSGNKIIEIQWSKASRTAPVVMTTMAGDPVTLMPGQTWVELVPQSGVGHRTAIDFS